MESFLEACREDGELFFDWQHLAVLAWNLCQQRRQIKEALETQGLRFRERPNVRRVRTMKDNPHDRWYGPGASPTHGGSGFASQEG